MGFRISWLAIEGVGKERLLSALNLIDTGEADEANETDLSVAELPTGWCVLWSNDERFAASVASRLSCDLGPVLAVSVNETCMHMTAIMFDGGGQRWWVHHEADDRIDFLETESSLPKDAAAIKARLRTLQAEEDAGRVEVDHLADVPLEIAKSICGYKHDEMRFSWGEPAFTAVADASSEPMQPLLSQGAASFWRRLIGKAS